MNFAFYETPAGKIRIDYKNDIVFGIHWASRFSTPNEKGVENFGANTTPKKPLCTVDTKNNGENTAFADSVFAELSEYFIGNRKSFTFKYELIGTDFQKKVWRALCDIPYGETCSYKDIAIAIGNEKASRAVGMANNKNPISIAVPCHRVIGKNGKLVGYGGGLSAKEKLLEIEKGV